MCSARKTVSLMSRALIRIYSSAASCRLVSRMPNTFATRALEQGMDVVRLSRLLGHATPSVTLDKYGHALNDHKRASVEKLGGVYSAGRGVPWSWEQ